MTKFQSTTNNIHRLVRGFIFALIVVSQFALSENNRFANLTIEIPNTSKIDYRYDSKKLMLTISIANIDVKSLPALDTYDENVIRRIVLKQMNADVEISFILKDRGLTYELNIYDQPQRIHLDIFDKNYRPTQDPLNGLPVHQDRAVKSKAENDLDNEPIEANQAEEFAEISSDTSHLSTESSKYQLLHQKTDAALSTNIQDYVAKIPEGFGSAWVNYPLYIYRIDINAHKIRDQLNSSILEQETENFSNAYSIAENAEKLLSLGHEKRALSLYQLAMQKDPRIFDKEPIFLWNFAEAHLGQKNLMLADAYYQAVIDKHPNSVFAKYSALRRADIRSIPLYAQNSNTLKDLVPALEKIRYGDEVEAKAHYNIRKAFWQNAINTKSSLLPQISPELAEELKLLLRSPLAPRTTYILNSLLMEFYTLEKTAWNKEAATFASDYFKLYSNASEIQISALKDQLKLKISAHIEGLSNKGEHLAAVQSFEELPKSLQSIKKEPETAWAIAESYRKAGSTLSAAKFYEISNSHSDVIKSATSAFWVSYTSKDALASNPAKINPTERAQLNNYARKFDPIFSSKYMALNDTQKLDVDKMLMQYYEDSIRRKLLLKTPAILVLQQRSQKPAINSEVVTNKSTQSSAANEIILLSRLAESFAELKMPQERRRALNLYKNVSPEEFSDDTTAKNIWARDLLKLAEEYRAANNYLEAGRTYAYTAEKSVNWDKKAESLYKGGLLLYRAGKATEAKEALSKACDDGDNLFYKNLACERLEKLEN
ncbi:MAG: hypothetical protein KBD78_12695 [Oligoflexales bacterium]|nr:hypothetical protein [Oligoflexales bacterium]